MPHTFFLGLDYLFFFLPGCEARRGRRLGADAEGYGLRTDWDMAGASQRTGTRTGNNGRAKVVVTVKTPAGFSLAFLTYPWVRYQVLARVSTRQSSYAMSKTAVATSPHRKAFANRRRDPETKREAVLQIAAQLFLEKSYGRTSMNDVAERLHITKPALYHYFHNKEEILLECYRLGSGLIEEILNEISAQCGTGLDKVAAFIYSYANVMTVNFGRCVMRMDEGDLSDDAFGEVRNYKRKIDRRLRAFIQEGIADGSITRCDPKIAAFSIAGALNWMCIWYEPEGPLPAEEIAQQFARTLTQGLASRRRRNGSRSKPTQESSK